MNKIKAITEMLKPACLKDLQTFPRHGTVSEQIFSKNQRASIKGPRACLLQDGHPIYFARKSLQDAERGYVTIKLEALAVTWAIEKFHHFHMLLTSLWKLTKNHWKQF